MSLVNDIRNGVYDEDLDDIQTSVIARKKVKGRMNFAQLEVGDKVRFVSNVRPTYLAGMTATITGKKVSKLIIRLDSPIGKFRGGTITCPPALLEPIK